MSWGFYVEGTGPALLAGFAERLRADEWVSQQLREELQGAAGYLAALIPAGRHARLSTHGHLDADGAGGATVSVSVDAQR